MMIKSLTIAGLQFLALVSPGIDFALVVRNSLTYSRRVALWTAAGIAFGVIFHLAYCLFGLSLFTHQQSPILDALKFMGCLFLVYIGIKSILARPISINEISVNNQKTSQTLSVKKAFSIGFITNALNPKAFLFFVGLFSSYLETEYSWYEYVFYLIEMPLVTFLWFAFVAYVFTNPTLRSKIISIKHWIERVMGVAILYFVYRLIF